MLYIRTDMNETVATGHMMRCLAIADAVAKIGGKTAFILADEQAVGLIGEHGHQTIVLHTRWDDMDAELDILQKLIGKYEVKTLLIDSYKVTQNYLSVLSKRIKTIYIDDIGVLTYPVHALICYAVYWKKFCYEENYRQTKLLLGPRYTPLRDVFCGCEKKMIKASVENLLLLSGGTDQFHILEGLLEKIEKERYRSIVIICGKYYQEYEILCDRYRHYKQMHFHKSVSNIEEYMKEADIVVSAGGTTLYEICACGTPAISYSFVDNQKDNVMQFQRDDLIDYAGDARDTDIFENVNLIIKRYANDPALRKKRSRRMQELVDGQGAKRIAEILIEMTEGR